MPTVNEELSLISNYFFFQSAHPDWIIVWIAALFIYAVIPPALTKIATLFGFV